MGDLRIVGVSMHNTMCNELDGSEKTQNSTHIYINTKPEGSNCLLFNQQLLPLGFVRQSNGSVI